MRIYYVPSIVLVPENFAENQMEKTHVITDYLFYSGWEKDNKCVTNKWLYMYLLVINDMNKN